MGLAQSLQKTARALLGLDATPSLAAPSSPVGEDAPSTPGAAQLENAYRKTWLDPQRANFWAERRTYDDFEAEACGRNGLIRRALTQRAFDATREGWSVRFREGTLDPQEAVEANQRLRAQQKRLNAAAKLRLADMRSEQYGHAIIVVGADDGQDDLSQPLNVDAVSRVLWLKVYARPEYTLGPLSPATSRNFGYPEYYDISNFHRPEVSAFETAQFESGTKRVHHSRILGPFHTEDGHSRLDEIGQALEDFFSTQTAASKLADSLSIAVVKIKGLLGKLTQNAPAVRGRMSLLQTGLSMVGALVLDNDGEDFTFQNRTASGLSDLVSDKAQLLTAFTGLPAMILLGAEPRGFSTGEEIIDQYYASARAEQTDKLEAPIRRLIDLLLRSADGPQVDVSPDDWSIVFAPLRTPSAAELAEIRAKLWTAINQLADKGLLTRDEARSAIADEAAAPGVSLSEEGSQQEASALAVGQMQALVTLLTTAYPAGAPNDAFRAVLEAALPMLTDFAPRIFPEPPAPSPEEAAAADTLAAEEEARLGPWLTAEEIAQEFGSITKGQLKRKRAPEPRQTIPGHLTWTKPGSKPLYSLKQVRELYDVAGPDLDEGTSDDPVPSAGSAV